MSFLFRLLPCLGIEELVVGRKQRGTGEDRGRQGRRHVGSGPFFAGLAFDRTALLTRVRVLFRQKDFGAFTERREEAGGGRKIARTIPA